MLGFVALLHLFFIWFRVQGLGLDRFCVCVLAVALGVRLFRPFAFFGGERGRELGVGRVSGSACRV